jgi:hypothetical protein
VPLVPGQQVTWTYRPQRPLRKPRPVAAEVVQVSSLRVRIRVRTASGKMMLRWVHRRTSAPGRRTSRPIRTQSHPDYQLIAHRIEQRPAIAAQQRGNSEALARSALGLVVASCDAV